MRVYRADGTFAEDATDAAFGWWLGDVVVDEAVAEYGEANRRTREAAAAAEPGTSARKYISKKQDESIYESIDSSFIDLNPYIREPSIREPVIIEHPNIEIQPVKSVTDCKMSIEGTFEDKSLSNFKRELKSIDINFPQKETLANLINPCNPEARMLLSIISDSKYKNLESKDASDALFKTINFKSTKYNRLINDEQTMPHFKCLINDEEVNSDQELIDEIQNYHSTKEDNMLSLMMELIITDLDSSVGDMSDLNQCINEINNTQPIQETSDLGNSIQSNCSSKDFARREFLEVPNRSEVLSSIGLSEDIDRSIQSWTEEKNEMHKELIEIKENFQQDEKKVNRLIEEACALEKDLRETLYLDNVIRLLKGETEKVKNKKWPFRIFNKDASEEISLII